MTGGLFNCCVAAIMPWNSKECFAANGGSEHPGCHDVAAMQVSVPRIRVRRVNDAKVQAEGDYVLYWMVAFRRVRWNFAMQRAAGWANELGKPLVILEALRCGYPWASDRLHQFVIQGMYDNQRDLETRPVCYYPYLEKKHGEGSGLLTELAKKACLVVTDDFPCFFLPRMIEAAGRKLPVALEAVDSNGLLPLAVPDKDFARAYDFRRYLQKTLKPHLEVFPSEDPFAGLDFPQPPKLDRSVTKKWPVADLKPLANDGAGLADFDIDHSVPPVETRGGSHSATRQLRSFLSQLNQYSEYRNDPDHRATSGLSPYLHFGHISAHQVFHELMDSVGWSIDKISEKASGAREGWWQATEAAESYLDELITWRELGYNMCKRRDDYDQYESLPGWAQETLAEHASDKREFVYSLGQFERAETHDSLWNAAQRELLQEGRLHNYLRMVWGKKILEWTKSPREALEVMIELNNKFALDGRNPNSYSGIFWVLGRYDRAWGPERPVYGKIRYMSCDNTRRKVALKEYLARYGDPEQENAKETK